MLSAILKILMVEVWQTSNLQTTCDSFGIGVPMIMAILFLYYAHYGISVTYLSCRYFHHVIYYIIRYARELFLIAITFWWVTTYHNAFIPQTILFFSLGAYFSIFDINPLRIASENKAIIIILFGIFAFGDIFSHTVIGTPINLQLHRFSIILNIPVLLLLADWCVRHEYTCKLLPNSAFIVFCVHYPIVVLLRRICISKFSDSSDLIHILLYFACVIVATLLSIGFYCLLERFFPKVKNLLSVSHQ